MGWRCQQFDRRRHAKRIARRPGGKGGNFLFTGSDKRTHRQRRKRSRRPEPRWRQSLIGRNRHHMLPRKRGGSRGPENLLVMRVKRHAVLHMLFCLSTMNEIEEILLECSKSPRARGRLIFSRKRHEMFRYLFRGKNFEQAARLIARVIRAKAAQRRRHIINRQHARAA